MKFSSYHNQSSKNGIGLSWSGLGRGEEKELERGCGGREQGRGLLRKRWGGARNGEAPQGEGTRLGGGEGQQREREISGLRGKGTEEIE